MENMTLTYLEKLMNIKLKYIKLFEEVDQDKLNRLKRLGLIEPDPYYDRVVAQLEEAGINIDSKFNWNDEAYKPKPDFSKMEIGIWISYNNLNFDLEWDNEIHNGEFCWRLSWTDDVDEIDLALSLDQVINIVKTSGPKPEEQDLPEDQIDADLKDLPKDAQKKLMAIRNKMKDLGI